MMLVAHSGGAVHDQNRNIALICAGWLLVCLGALCAGLLLTGLFAPAGFGGDGEDSGLVSRPAALAYFYFLSSAALAGGGAYLLLWRRRWRLIPAGGELERRDPLQTWRLMSRWPAVRHFLHLRPVTHGLVILNVLISWGFLQTELPDFTVLGNYAPLTFQGDFWRLWSNTFVHVSWGHLAGNMFFLWYVGRYVEAIYGPARYLLLYFSSGGFGSLVSALMQPTVVAVGASGAIFGILGAELAFALYSSRTLHIPDQMRQNLGKLTWVVVRVGVYGLVAPGPSTDVWAHVGGLVAGFALGLLLRRSLAARERSQHNGVRPLWVMAAVVLVLTLPLWTAGLGGPQAHAKALVKVHAIQAARANFLGIRYRDGKKGLTANQGKADRWFSQAAAAGDVNGQFNLARQYELGAGVPQDMALAVLWYRRAADQGLASAQTNLGVCYAKGEGVAVDPQEALKWFRKSAAQGDAVGEADLGIAYWTGLGLPRNAAEAAGWFEKASRQGYASAQRNLGRMLMTGDGIQKDEAAAATWLNKAANQGDAAAQSALGDLYLTGGGVAQDDAAAARLFRKAAEQNFVEAQYKLGVLLKRTGPVHDPSEAVRWLGRAADQNSAQAQNALGEYYRDGGGPNGEPSLERAAYWFGRAASQGLPAAQNNLRTLYARGDGVRGSHGGQRAPLDFTQRTLDRRRAEGAAQHSQTAQLAAAPSPASLYEAILAAFLSKACAGAAVETLSDQLACVDSHTQPSAERTVFDAAAAQLLLDVQGGKLEERAARRAIYQDLKQRAYPQTPVATTH